MRLNIVPLTIWSQLHLNIIPPVKIWSVQRSFKSRQLLIFWKLKCNEKIIRANKFQSMSSSKVDVNVKCNNKTMRGQKKLDFLESASHPWMHRGWKSWGRVWIFFQKFWGGVHDVKNIKECVLLHFISILFFFGGGGRGGDNDVLMGQRQRFTLIYT